MLQSTTVKANSVKMGNYWVIKPTANASLEFKNGDKSVVIMSEG